MWQTFDLFGKLNKDDQIEFLYDEKSELISLLKNKKMHNVRIFFMDDFLIHTYKQVINSPTNTKENEKMLKRLFVIMPNEIDKKEQGLEDKQLNDIVNRVWVASEKKSVVAFMHFFAKDFSKSIF